MERFAIKIDKNLKANLCKICRLCGIDNPDKVKILDDETIVNLEEGEPELWKKVLDCIGLLITKDDKMPQFMCTLCVDKINDFFEFREMCYATDIQTRKLLGIKEEPKIKLPGKTSPTDCKAEAQDVKQPIPVVPAQRPGRKRRNADMEVCSTLKDIKTDDIKDVKPTTASPGLTSAKKKRLKLESTDTDTLPETDTKIELNAKTALRPGPASKIGLAKKRLKMEPTAKDKKDLKTVKVTKLLRGNLKTEPPTTAEERRPTPFQLKKKKAIELLKQRKLAKQVAVVKVEKLRKASIDAKIKEEAPRPVPLSGANQPKVKLKEACTICSESYVNKTLLDKHIKATHIPTIARYHCVHCNETLKKNMEIKNHNLWHKLSKTPFQCGNCSETSCSIYTYSKHIRDCGQVSYIDAQVPDWHCPECRGVFETTYLFNIHSCVSNALVCPGCDRSHKWKEDYFKHIPTCAAAVHRIPSYMTPNIQVKNEAEHPSCSPIPQNHAHISHTAAAPPSAQAPQPSRITPPLMDSHQCVVIPGNVSLHEEAASPSPKESCKKSKRITKKDLKRFDKLLKSTMTTLVSIKQEPALCEGTQQSGSVDIRASSESPSASPEPTDDHFYNDDDDDDESADEQSFPQAVGAIKQEIVDEGYRDLYSNIELNVKRELTEHDAGHTEVKKKGGDTSGASLHVDSQPPKPVLKLKITKEHGMLNSILLDSPKSEKKKKKKKRKDEKHRDREDAENIPRGSTKAKAAVELTEDPVVDPPMPLPGIVRVKEEIPDPEEEKETSKDQFPSDAVHCVPSIVAATSGSLQISCVSEGVNFNGAEENEDRTVEEDISPEQSSEMEANPLCSESQEPVDIKPRLEDLIPMPTLQISSVSSGEDVLKTPVKRKRGRPPGSTKASTSTPKILSVSSGSDVHFEPEPRIASKSGDVDNNENVFDYTQVRVKEEVMDPAFDVQDNQVPQKAVEDEVVETEAEEPICDKHADESAYIANIDFNNLSIKQEKEYIDDGLDNPLGFVDDDDADSDTDSESSSDSDSDGSESEREYRELPSETEEDTSNATSNTIAPSMGLQISEVRSEYTCLQANEKTEAENGAELGSSENKTESNAATECRKLDIPNPGSDQSAEADSSCQKEQESSISSIPLEGTPDDSLLSLDLTDGGFSLLNSESDLQAASAESKESECLLLEPSSIFSDPSTTRNAATNALLLDEVDCELNEVATSKDMHAIDSSFSQSFDAGREVNKSLTEQFATSVDSLDAHPSNMFAEKEDDLKTSDLSDLVQRNLLPVDIMDHFSPAEVSFTVMPVERTQTDHSARPSVEDSASGTSTSKEEDSKSPEPSPYCSLTQAVADVPAIGDELSSEEANMEKPSSPEMETTEASTIESVAHISLLDSPFSRIGAVSLGNKGPPIPISAPESMCQPSASILEPSERKEITASNALQLSPAKLFYHTSEAFGTTSVQSIVDAQELSSNEDPPTNEHFPGVDAIGAGDLEQQGMLIDPPAADSLTLHLPSNFGEAQSSSSDIFNATIGLDSHFSAELERQDLDANVSIDLCDVLSNSTLHAPTAVAVLSPLSSNSNFSQSTRHVNVNDTSRTIPYSTDLQHLSSDTNFIESSLNFTELCRNNASLGSLSDFHINTSTAGHLHNLISSIDAHPPQLMPELSGISSSSANNTDLNVPVLSEEVQNLLNEDTVAASNFELNDSILRARCSSSMNAFSPAAPVAVSVRNFTDLENVNEIAENNNNANIERELQDELGNALAAAIADRSPNDEADENNVINENRANFDLT